MDYTCLNCQKKVNHENIRTRVRCIYCGYKILYKERSSVSVVKAR